MADGDKYTLAIDTATPCSSVALTTGTRLEGRVLASLVLGSNVTHSRRLLKAVDWLIGETGIQKEQIRGYAVGQGPGSFTGLRIGMATAKGLAAASETPLYGVSTLDVLAAGVSDQRLICAVLDARKKEVYVAYYRCDENGLSHRVSDIFALSPEALGDQLTEPVVMVGDGLAVYGAYWQSRLQEKMTTTPIQLWIPSAASLGLLAGELERENLSLDIGSASPLYVRASDAELKLKTHS